MCCPAWKTDWSLFNISGNIFFYKCVIVSMERIIMCFLFESKQKFLFFRVVMYWNTFSVSAELQKKWKVFDFFFCLSDSPVVFSILLCWTLIGRDFCLGWFWQYFMVLICSWRGRRELIKRRCIREKLSFFRSSFFTKKYRQIWERWKENCLAFIESYM